MVVQAYILIQTEVGKAATVAESDRQHLRRHPGRGRHRPLRRHRPRRGPHRRRARQARHRQDPGRPGHHPHADLHGRPRLSTSRARLEHVCDPWSPHGCALRAAGPPASRPRGLPLACSVPAPPGWRQRPAAGRLGRLRRQRPPVAEHRRRPGTRRHLRCRAAVAAWGDPPVIARCGLARARAPRPTSASASDGVDWVGGPAERRRALHDLRPRSRRSRSWCRGPTARSRCCCRPFAAAAARALPAERPHAAASRAAQRSPVRRAQRELDQLVDQLRVVQAGGRPHPRVHRVRREARASC